MALPPFLAALHTDGAQDADPEVITTRIDVRKDTEGDNGERGQQFGRAGASDGQVVHTLCCCPHPPLLSLSHQLCVCSQESRVENQAKSLPEKILVAGNPEVPEVHLRVPGAGAALVAHRQAQRRNRNGSRGSGDLERFQISAESCEARLGKGVDSEARQIYLLAKATCGRDGESPKSSLHPKIHGELGQKQELMNDVLVDLMPEPRLPTTVASLVTQPVHGEIAIQVRTLPNQPSDEQEESHSSRDQAIKNAMKFSYVAISISGAALITIFFEYYVNQSRRDYNLHLKICTLIMLSSFLSGVSIPLLNFVQHHTSVSLQVFKSLKCTTFALLILALLDVSFLFMKIIALFAFIPTIAAVVIACVIASDESSSSSYDHHQQ
ncbi:hypothetical protein Cni_G23146 [Canna indica]|uniref:PGG domain-containing protein n=1 Tax=Canna indica TaxID=4628 RepID=A0AAQ3KY04_9LILI|nr:hypothetical protein Cni_G23146 [Canna indica]